MGSGLTLEYVLAHMARSQSRLFVIIGLMFLIVVYVKPAWMQKYAIPQFKFSKPRYFREAVRSVLVFFIYVTPAIVLKLAETWFGYSVMYTDFNEFGLFYFILSIFLLWFVMDTVYFWIHFAMHRVKFLNKTHVFHHSTVSVNPLATYSVNIQEAFFMTLPTIAALLIVPWHPLAYVIYAPLLIIHGGYIHSGYDFFSRSKTIRLLTSWYHSPTHHSLHHQKYECNYGLYFTWWDKLMGTEDLRGEESNLKSEIQLLTDK